MSRQPLGIDPRGNGVSGAGTRGSTGAGRVWPLWLMAVLCLGLSGCAKVFVSAPVVLDGPNLGKNRQRAVTAIEGTTDALSRVAINGVRTRERHTSLDTALKISMLPALLQAQAALPTGGTVPPAGGTGEPAVSPSAPGGAEGGTPGSAPGALTLEQAQSLLSLSGLGGATNPATANLNSLLKTDTLLPLLAADLVANQGAKVNDGTYDSLQDIVMLYEAERDALAGFEGEADTRDPERRTFILKFLVSPQPNWFTRQGHLARLKLNFEMDTHCGACADEGLRILDVTPKAYVRRDRMDTSEADRFAFDALLEGISPEGVAGSARGAYAQLQAERDAFIQRYPDIVGYADGKDTAVFTFNPTFHIARSPWFIRFLRRFMVTSAINTEGRPVSVKISVPKDVSGVTVSPRYIWESLDSPFLPTGFPLLPSSIPFAAWGNNAGTKIGDIGRRWSEDKKWRIAFEDRQPSLKALSTARELNGNIENQILVEGSNLHSTALHVLLGNTKLVPEVISPSLAIVKIAPLNEATFFTVTEKEQVKAIRDSQAALEKLTVAEAAIKASIEKLEKDLEAAKKGNGGSCSKQKDDGTTEDICAEFNQKISKQNQELAKTGAQLQKAQAAYDAAKSVTFSRSLTILAVRPSYSNPIDPTEKQEAEINFSYTPVKKAEEGGEGGGSKGAPAGPVPPIKVTATPEEVATGSFVRLAVDEGDPGVFKNLEKVEIAGGGAAGILWNGEKEEAFVLITALPAGIEPGQSLTLLLSFKEFKSTIPVRLRAFEPKLKSEFPVLPVRLENSEPEAVETGEVPPASPRNEPVETTPGGGAGGQRRAAANDGGSQDAIK